jgi:hypothetical protein
MPLFLSSQVKEGWNMKKTMNTRLALGMACSVGLALGLSGTIYAGPAEHSNIVLKDAAGTELPVGSTTAYSAKETCGGCHNYNSIERHATHAQMAANAIGGFNPYNPDSKMGEKANVNSKGKNWVQSTGHVGKW